MLLPKKLSTPQDVEDAYQLAVVSALDIVERYARTVLRRNRELDEFVMGMGDWGFTKNEEEDGMFQEYAGALPLIDFIDKWDDYLKLTGEPMRFTATGDVVREW